MVALSMFADTPAWHHITLKEAYTDGSKPAGLRTVRNITLLA